MSREFPLGLVGSAVTMGLAAIASAATNDLRVLAAGVALSAFLTGFLLRRRGALAGFGSVFLVSSAWALFVMARSWVEGDLARAHPNCDPCGFVGYAGRMLIITVMSLGTFGVLAAVAGWLGEVAARRARPRSPAARRG